MSLAITDYLKANLKVEVTCDTDYLGTPYVKVVLLLDSDIISESEASIPKSNYDPDW